MITRVLPLLLCAGLSWAAPGEPMPMVGRSPKLLNAEKKGFDWRAEFGDFHITPDRSYSNNWGFAHPEEQLPIDHSGYDFIMERYEKA
eukprot:scaffold3153_cov243-Pinguiococcus_pyrenoidosus.AAC.3